MTGRAPERSRRVHGHSIPEVVLRTRMSVMVAAHEMHTRRARARRQAGIALAVLAGVMVLVAPALWSTANELSEGEHFLDMPVVLLTLSLIMLTAMLAVLLMTWRGSRNGERER